MQRLNWTFREEVNINSENILKSGDFQLSLAARGMFRVSCSAVGVSHSLGRALSTKGNVSPNEASLFTHFGSCFPVRI